MNNQKPAMFVPSLVAGGLAGILSGIPLLNCLCCLWIIGGAILATFLLAKDAPSSLTPGDGAIVGILTGIVAAFVALIVSLPFQNFFRSEIFRNFMDRFSQYTEDMPSGWEDWLQRDTSLAMTLIGLVISVFIFSALGALGGIIGAATVGKKKSPPPVPGAPDASQDPGHRQS